MQHFYRFLCMLLFYSTLHSFNEFEKMFSKGIIFCAFSCFSFQGNNFNFLPDVLHCFYLELRDVESTNNI